MFQWEIFVKNMSPCKVCAKFHVCTLYDLYTVESHKKRHVVINANQSQCVIQFCSDVIFWMWTNVCCYNKNQKVKRIKKKMLIDKIHIYVYLGVPNIIRLKLSRKRDFFQSYSLNDCQGHIIGSQSLPSLYTVESRHDSHRLHIQYIRTLYLSQSFHGLVTQ